MLNFIKLKIVEDIKENSGASSWKRISYFQERDGKNNVQQDAAMPLTIDIAYKCKNKAQNSHSYCC